MNKLRLAFRAALFVSITLTLASLAQAQLTRTWVSGVGDDANPCNRTSPCKTFAGAISKTVMGGEVDFSDSTGVGTVRITKSITIDGTGTLAGVLAAGADGITIDITDPNDSAKSVRLRGLSINGLGSGLNGIRVVAANKVSIEDCVIDGFTADGINVSAGAVFVRNTTIRNNAGAGIRVGSTASAGLTDVSLVFNGLASVGGTLIQKFNNVVVFGRFNRTRRLPFP